ncbi:ThiF family adenylyltransferase [Legionella santicrucis]|nr:ThiF family adenylyltransferase [Legionella santicrucis]
MKDLFNYEELISRNYQYIAPKTQEKIQKTRLVFLGTGLSSTIAECCTRLGFTKIYLQDGDTIEFSNLNRQAFSIHDMHKSKAVALKNKLLAINSLCDIQANTNYIKSIHECSEQINQGDIIINTIDCNKTYFDIIEYARTQNKLVICPFNPGFSGLAVAFNQNSCSSYEFFGINHQYHLNDLEVAKQLFIKYPQINTLKQANQSLDQFLETITTQGYFPQIIIGALMTTALVLTMMIKFLNDEPIALAPDIDFKK